MPCPSPGSLSSSSIFTGTRRTLFLCYLLGSPPSSLSIQVLITGQRSEQLEQERAAQPWLCCHSLGLLFSQELAGTGVPPGPLGSCMEGSEVEKQ